VLAAVLLPGGHPVDESGVRLSLEMAAQPSQVDAPRIVAALLLWQHVAGLPLSTKKTADGRIAHAEQLRCLLVRTALLRAVGCYDSASKVDR
jgi:hypothetical protein